MARNDSAASRPLTYTDKLQLGRIATGSLPDAHNNRELFVAKASRIVDLFPDKIIVQEKTVSVVEQQLFTSVVSTLPIKDIGRVVYLNAPFFGGIEILGKNPTHDMRIVGLKKPDAMRAKQLIEDLLLYESGSTAMPLWLSAGDSAEHVPYVDHTHDHTGHTAADHDHHSRH